MNIRRSIIAAGVAGLCLFGTVAASADPPSNVIMGTRGRDTLVGTRGRDVIFGLQRRDTLFGGGSFDKLFGGPGSDRLASWGDNRRDIVVGGRPGPRLVARLGLRGDRCVVDARDITFGCEKVVIRSVPPGNGN